MLRIWKIVISFIFVLYFIPQVTYSIENANVKIISPSNGDTFTPGDKVQIITDATENIKMILVTAGSYHSALLDKPPFETSFILPHDTPPGVITITAGGRGESMDLFNSDEIEINIDLSEDIKINTIKVYPDFEPITLPSPTTKGAQIPINVYGYFNDGNKREITPRGSGTKYESSDNSIFVIDYSYGVSLRPVNCGEAYLYISHGSINKKIKVIVNSD